MLSIWIEVFTPFAPRFYRCKSPAQSIAMVEGIDQEVNLPIDSHSAKWGVRKFFSEDSNCQVLQANEGWVGRVDQEAIRSNLQFKPLCLEHCKLWLGDFQFGSVDHLLG